MRGAVPGLATTSHALLGAVREHGAVVLAHTPLDDASLIVLTARLGLVTAQDNGFPGRMVWDIREDPAAAPDPHAQQRDHFDLHTDSTFADRPHDVIGMACVTPAADGSGRSLLLPVDRVVRALRAAGRHAEVAELGRPLFPFPAAGPPGARPPRLRPVLTDSAGRARIRYRRDLLERGRTEAAAHGLDIAAAGPVLVALAHALADPDLPTGLLLAPGEYLLLDNARVLHGRTAVTAGSGRRLRRLKLRDATPGTSPEHG
jgi:alpha-ketoglutarate-dependent taurine dioxygenase